MEKKSSKSKDKIMRFLPKSVSFQHRSAFSPTPTGRSPYGKLFSSPMIPAEAREPTSPKISCMGQIKHKHRACKAAGLPLPSPARPEKISKARTVGPGSELKSKPAGAAAAAAGMRKLFGASRKSDAGRPPVPAAGGGGCGGLGQVRRFASSRETLANFDWTTVRIAPEEESRLLAAGGGAEKLETRKEINLWKRRTMAQPKPLQLNIVRAQ